MALTLDKAIAIADRHIQAMFTDLRREMGTRSGTGLEGATPEAATAIAKDWNAAEIRHEVTFPWPDGNVDTYPEFTIFESHLKQRVGVGRTRPAEYRGRERTWFVVFDMNGTKLGNPLAVFYEADDFAASNETVALIRGKGESKRACYAPSDPLPSVYSVFKTETFSDRIGGERSYNRTAVLAQADDPATMAAFATVQKEMRFEVP